MSSDIPRILVVDDDRAVLDTYLRALVDYAPLHARDGVEARDILSETAIDLVLCDLEMPRMNGLDLMRWAREHCPRPLWIMVSGQGTFDAAAQALNLGAFDFVCKPVQSSLQLQTVVANAVHHLALLAERAALLQSLAEKNLSLVDTNGKLQAALAVLRDQRAMLDQDLQRAESVLRSLFPRALRSIQGMHVAAAYRPSMAIGGDFYGAAMLDDRHLAVYVADVAGHGVSAALLAVLFHQRLASFHGQSRQRTPATVLADLNRGLLEECRASGLFVTVAYALIDTVERTASIASAGHPPGLVLRRSGAIERLEKTGAALGLALETRYGEHRITLAAGDRLFLYTDGLSGAMAERAGELEAELSRMASTSGDGASVIGHLVDWSAPGGREGAEDDVTLLLVTAASGVSTFDEGAVRPPRPCAPPSGCALAVGSSEGATWVAVHGAATWKDAGVLRATCADALDAGRHVMLDLTRCIMLDSTILGTLHELVVRAEPRHSLHLQGASTEIRDVFEELAMTQVVAALVTVTRPAPASMVDLRPEGNGGQALVLPAHQLLAGLSPGNAEQFQPVIEALERESLH